jgi:hypothetical protein
MVERRRYADPLRRSVMSPNTAQKQLDRGAADRLDVLRCRGELGFEEIRPFEVVVTDEGHVGWNRQAEAAQGFERSDGHGVVQGHQRSRPVLSRHQSVYFALSHVGVGVAIEDQSGVDCDTAICERRGVTIESLSGGRDSGNAAYDGDPTMPEVEQVLGQRACRVEVFRAHLIALDVDTAVDQNQRSSSAGDFGEGDPLRPGRGSHDHPVDLPVQERVGDTFLRLHVVVGISDDQHVPGVRQSPLHGVNQVSEVRIRQRGDRESDRVRAPRRE